jgi:hypothetical protein
MTTYATQDMIADALIYGVQHNLRSKPSKIVIDQENDSVSCYCGTKIVKAPPLKPRKAGGAVVGRKWPADVSQCYIYDEDGDYVEVDRAPGDDLTTLMATANCVLANKLGKAQLIAVWYCVLHKPFPGGEYATYYRAVLQQVEADALKRANASLLGLQADTYLGEEAWLAADAMTLGGIRRALVVKAGSGCNAPTDSYLQAAVESMEMT